MNTNYFVGVFSKENMDELIGKEKAAKLWDAVSEFDPKEYKNPLKRLEVTDKKHALMVGKHLRLAECLIESGCTDLDIWIRMAKDLMVLIDCRKYNLDFEQSYIDNGMNEIYTKYYTKK